MALAPAKVPFFGMGGDASAAAGIEIVADIRRSAAMGFTEVATTLPRLAMSFARLSARIRRQRPRAAVLVNYTEYNHLLGRRLRKIGVPVMWCVAPQVWAWRPERTAAIAQAVDRMAVILPFEEAIWQKAGVDAHYVGHPALDDPRPTRAEARARLSLEGDGPFVALLPGSRAHEVRRLAPSMLAAVAALKQSAPRATARLLAAGSLDSSTSRWLRAAAARGSGRDHRRRRPRGRARLPCGVRCGVGRVGHCHTRERARRSDSRRGLSSFQDDRCAGASHGSNTARGSPQRHPRGRALSRAAARASRTDHDGARAGARSRTPNRVRPKSEELRRRLAWSTSGSRSRGGTSSERVAALLSDWIEPR